MHRCLRLIFVALVVCGVAATTSLARTSSSFRTQSTLDGMTVLPHHIRWLGKPNLPPGQIKEVDFLIDGKLGWIEHHAPYVYSSDDPGHLGYLVTSWLAPGVHSFEVKAIAKGGRTAVDIVRARVVAPVAPPAALAGTWKRDIPDTSAAPKSGTPGNPTGSFTPPGTYAIIFEKRWIRDIQPGKFYRPVSDKTGAGWWNESDYVPGLHTFRVWGAVTRFPFNDNLADGGGWLCWQDGPAATYTWSVSGDTLTLTPVGGRDACGIRGFIFAGQWTRAH
jgi:hypothetical protein